MTSKYHSVKTEVDGVVFDSRAESRRYEELTLLERIGEISDLRLQPEYELQAGFVHRGKKIRPIVYRADFSYTENGVLVVEDVKSPATRTPLFEVKRKLFLFRFPDLLFRIVE